MKLNGMKEIYDYMCSYHVLSVTIGDTFTNAVLVKGKEGGFKVALQGYGYYPVEAFYYLLNRYNVEVHVESSPSQEIDFCQVTKYMLDEFTKEG